MDKLIEVSANDYKKGIEAVAKLEIIERYLNENQYINGNDMRMIVGLPKINRWGEFETNVVKENLESN